MNYSRFNAIVDENGNEMDESSTSSSYIVDNHRMTSSFNPYGLRPGEVVCFCCLFLLFIFVFICLEEV